MTAEIESVPTPSLIEAVPAPRRGRGRPPAVDPVTGERKHPPRQSGGRKRSTTRRTPQRSRAPKTLYPDIAAMLGLANTIVGFTPIGSVYADKRTMQPDGTFGRMSHSSAAYTETTFVMLGGVPIPNIEDHAIKVHTGDELDAGEITLLAKAIDAQCRRSPRVRKIVERILGVGVGGQIVTAVGMIATRRAARHGLMPAYLDGMIGGIIEGGDLGAIGDFVLTPDGTGEPVAETGEEPPQPTGDDFETMG